MFVRLSCAPASTSPRHIGLFAPSSPFTARCMCFSCWLEASKHVHSQQHRSMHPQHWLPGTSCCQPFMHTHMCWPEASPAQQAALAHASMCHHAWHAPMSRSKSLGQRAPFLGYRLKAHSLRGGARAVLLAPTRELALQTHKVVKELSRYTNLRTAVLVGGDSMEAQFAELAANPDIIVATPGVHANLPLACVIKSVLWSVCFVMQYQSSPLQCMFCDAVPCQKAMQKLAKSKQVLQSSTMITLSLLAQCASGN